MWVYILYICMYVQSAQCTSAVPVCSRTLHAEWCKTLNGTLRAVSPLTVLYELFELFRPRLVLTEVQLNRKPASPVRKKLSDFIHYKPHKTHNIISYVRVLASDLGSLHPEGSWAPCLGSSPAFWNPLLPKSPSGLRLRTRSPARYTRFTVIYLGFM